MSNIPPLTHINVPEDIKITNIDLYSKNFCKEFGDINSDTERTKPIPTLDMVINWSNKLEIEHILVIIKIVLIKWEYILMEKYLNIIFEVIYNV